jgi:hypothetical protein
MLLIGAHIPREKNLLEMMNDNFKSLINIINNVKIELENSTYIIKYTDDDNKKVNQIIFRGPTVYFGTSGIGKDFQHDHIVGLKIIKPNGESKEYMKTKATGGRKASVKKEICGRMRCIYKIQGSRKEHIKYKGRFITVADYKKLMKKA